MKTAILYESLHHGNTKNFVMQLKMNMMSHFSM